MNAIPRNQLVTVVVREVRSVTHRVRSFVLGDPDGWRLPPFTAGAHIDVHLPGDLVRQYSLCGDPADDRHYELGVLDEPDGRGGSRTFHTVVERGAVLSVSLPRNHFPLAADAGRHIFIAGGIGITPFLSMMPVLERQGAPFVLHACARTRDDAPFIDRLQALGDQGRVVVHPTGGDPRRRLDVGTLLATRNSGDHVYCCGPEPLMRAVQAASVHWPAGTVHFEKFGAAGPAASPEAAGYAITLARSGRRVVVANGTTMAAALRDAGIAISTSCEAGTCGTCKTRFIAGDVVHSDFVLRQEERGAYVMPCVSGCRSPELVLDI